MSTMITPDETRRRFEDALPTSRNTLALSLHAPAEALLDERTQQLRSTEGRWRDLASAIQGGRRVADHEIPVARPDLKEVETWYLAGLVAAVLLELGTAVVGTKASTDMELAACIGVGIALSGGIALIAKASAVADVSGDSLAERLRMARRRVGWGAFAVVLLICMTYLLRGGLGPIAWVVGLLATSTFLLAWLARLLGCLYHVHRSLRLLAEYAARLRSEIGDLRASLEIIEHHLIDAPSFTTAVAGAQPDRVPGSRNRPSRNGGGRRMVRSLTVLVLSIGVTHNPGRAISQEAHRVGFSVDASSTGEQSNEQVRFRSALARYAQPFVIGLGGTTAVEVLCWHDAESVWSAGMSFELPHMKRPELEGERSLRFFGKAAKKEVAVSNAKDSLIQIPSFSRISSELLRGPKSPPIQSCPFDAIGRAYERAEGYWLVTTDGEPFRCDSKNTWQAGGATVAIALTPRREGTATRERMRERQRRIEAMFPEAIVLTSFDLVSEGDFRRLAMQMRAKASEARP